ncbi:MAG: sigma-70 family RNA polymerase sigma factor [Mariprofundaceae bacterium]|nr:sigma-70 family RNA polymerase sigma factor [Mariprofundaceae bacterium]
MTTSFEFYMQEVSKHPLFSPEEEKACASRIAEGDPLARDQMIQANLRMVVKIARRYMRRGVDLNDLIEEGNIGLMRTVEKFDLRFGCRFSTYATWWVRQAVERSIMNQSRTVRLPVHVCKSLNKN